MTLHIGEHLLPRSPPLPLRPLQSRFPGQRKEGSQTMEKKGRKVTNQCDFSAGRNENELSHSAHICASCLDKCSGYEGGLHASVTVHASKHRMNGCGGDNG